MGFFKSILRPIAQVATFVTAPAVVAYTAGAKVVAPKVVEKVENVPVVGTVVRGLDASSRAYTNAADLLAEGKSPNMIRDYVDSLKGAAVVGAAMVGAGALGGAGGGAGLGLAEGAAAAGGGIGGAAASASLMDKILSDPIGFAGSYIDNFLTNDLGLQSGFFADSGRVSDPFAGGGGGGVRGIESPIIVGEPGEGATTWIIIGGAGLLVTALVLRRKK